MGRFKNKLKIGTAALVVVVALPAFAVDLTAETVLIKKLQNVLARLPENDPSRKDMVLRLADLHAERARLLSVNELEKGCTECNAGTEDRQQAIGLYEKILRTNDGADKGAVYTQLGHLYEMVGEKSKAITAYGYILKNSQDPVAIGEAHLSMGEIYFRQGDFRNAIPHYEKVMANDKSGGRGLAAYRRGWSLFNLGDDRKASEAMIEILKSPVLLTRGLEPGVVKPDSEFQAEVSRDLATFFGRQSITLDQAKQLFELSPKTAARANTAYLAKELERMGKIGPAIEVWRFVLSNETSPKERLTGLTLLAQLEMTSKLREPAIADFHAALKTWPQTSDCKDQNDPVCGEIRTRLKNFLINWNKEERQKPSQDLLEGYLAFLPLFPSDMDVSLYAGLVAKELKQYPKSFELFDSTIGLMSQELASDQKLDKKGRKELQDKLEGTLLNQIEVAEMSKDKGLLQKAYANFLSKSEDSEHKFKVQYQLAYMVYESGDYAKAANELYALAMMPGKGDLKIKKQAADLALDTLVILKDDVRIESWAGEFAGVFKDGSQDFMKAARASLMNQAAAAAKTGDQLAQLEQSWALLAKVSLDGASDLERINFYRNRAILAEKLNKWDELESSSKNLLAMGGLSAEDKEFALSKLVWVSELRLNFAMALQYSEQMKLTSLSAEDRQLRLAMLADLAEKDSGPYLRGYLKVSNNTEKNVAIATRLVNESKQPEKELGLHEKTLSKNSEVLARLYFEQYAESGSSKIFQKMVNNKELAATSSGRFFQRQLLLNKIGKAQKELMNHQIDTRSQSRLGRTLKARIKMLEDFEKLTAEALNSKDWIAQATTLQVLASESQRLYENILALPMPQGLTPEEQQQYLGLLSEQANPHMLKAQEVGQKAQEFWANQQATSQLSAVVQAEKGKVRELLKAQLDVAAAVAPEVLKTQWQTALAESSSQEFSGKAELTPQVAQARSAVQADPLNIEKLRYLMDLERQRKNAVMVTYLEGRLAKGMATSGSSQEGGKQ